MVINIQIKMIKILNLYAGIGGNRKLWDGDIEVTAVEINSEIAKIYQDFFPNDKVIVGDAHQYLLEHFREFDFIWSSPPCPTHSIINTSYYNREGMQRYPDMTLYQEIILLKYWFKGKYVVENVKSYYEPLIKPQESGNHYFWCNFIISKLDRIIRKIDYDDIDMKQRERDTYLDKYDYSKEFKDRVLNNMVFPQLGLHIFNCAFREKQETLV